MPTPAAMEVDGIVSHQNREKPAAGEEVADKPTTGAAGGHERKQGEEMEEEVVKEERDEYDDEVAEEEEEDEEGREVTLRLPAPTGRGGRSAPRTRILRSSSDSVTVLVPRGQEFFFFPPFISRGGGASEVLLQMGQHPAMPSARDEGGSHPPGGTAKRKRGSAGEEGEEQPSGGLRGWGDDTGSSPRSSHRVRPTEHGEDGGEGEGGVDAGGSLGGERPQGERSPKRRKLTRSPQAVGRYLEGPAEMGNLPPEVLDRIFFYLDVSDTFRVSRVCRMWHAVTNS